MGNVKRKCTNRFRRACRDNKHAGYCVPWSSAVARAFSNLMSGSLGANRKRFFIILLPIIITSALVPAVHGVEQGRQNALMRFADRRESSPPSQTQRIRANDLEAIAKLIAAINAAEKANKARVLRIIIINTNVAGSTLEQEKSRTGLSLGEVYVAHSLAMASQKSFNQIVALKAKGQSWAKIAQMHNISLKGSTAALKEMLRE